MLKKILICILVLCLVIPVGVAFADNSEFERNTPGSDGGAIDLSADEHNIMLTATNNKEGYVCSLHQRITFAYDNVKEYNLDFKTQEEYINWEYNYSSYLQLCGTYEVTLYKDDVALILRDAEEYIIHSNGHTFSFIDRYGNSINDITSQIGGPRRITIYDATLPTDWTFTVKEGGYLTLHNCLIDGGNKTVSHNLFNVFTYGSVILDNTPIKNINLNNNAELFNFDADNGNTDATVNGRGNSKIENIHSSGDGIIKLDDYYGNIKNLEFNNISSSGKGGCIYFTSGNIENCKFINCSSGDNGGALFMDCYFRGNVNTCTFEKCHSDEQGGAIYIDGTNTYIENSTTEIEDVGESWIHGCTFKECSSSDHGGAIYINARETEMQDNRFIGCTSGEDGGALYIDNTDCKISNCLFDGNESEVDGGAICIDEDDNIIYACQFLNNHSKDDGGAIYVTVGTDDIKIENCSFNGNHADDDEDNVDGNSDTEMINCGSTVSGGNVWLIVCIVEALALIFAVLYILKKKNPSKKA